MKPEENPFSGATAVWVILQGGAPFDSGFCEHSLRVRLGMVTSFVTRESRFNGFRLKQAPCHNAIC